VMVYFVSAFLLIMLSRKKVFDEKTPT
jgi:hypothetical protein